jgi:hypothetical protein
VSLCETASPRARPDTVGSSTRLTIPVQRPGLLVEWNQTDDDDWRGRVIYSAQMRPGEWTTLEEWLPVKSLLSRPAEA